MFSKPSIFFYSNKSAKKFVELNDVFLMCEGDGMRFDVWNRRNDEPRQFWDIPSVRKCAIIQGIHVFDPFRSIFIKSLSKKNRQIIQEFKNDLKKGADLIQTQKFRNADFDNFIKARFIAKDIESDSHENICNCIIVLLDLNFIF